MITLHYLFDPLSGACHGASPLIGAAREVTGIDVVLHSGGQFAGDRRFMVTPPWREAVLVQDGRMARLSRQPFGPAYFDDLLGTEGLWLDSAPPTTAILAAGELAGRSLPFMLRLQQAFFAEGRNVCEISVLRELAQELLFDLPAFDGAFARLAGEATLLHFTQTWEWLERAGGKAYPAVVLERPDGMPVPINLNAWYGRPADFAAALGRIGLTTVAG